MIVVSVITHVTIQDHNLNPKRSGNSDVRCSWRWFDSDPIILTIASRSLAWWCTAGCSGRIPNWIQREYGFIYVYCMVPKLQETYFIDFSSWIPEISTCKFWFQPGHISETHHQRIPCAFRYPSTTASVSSPGSSWRWSTSWPPSWPWRCFAMERPSVKAAAGAKLVGLYFVFDSCWYILLIFPLLVFWSSSDDDDHDDHHHYHHHHHQHHHHHHHHQHHVHPHDSLQYLVILHRNHFS